MKTKLFISSSPTELVQLQQYCHDNDILLTAQSLIDFKALTFEVMAPFDVVFFSSPRSFNYYNSSSNNLKSVDIAVIGSGTANHIKDKVSSIAFIGKESGNPQKGAQDFIKWLGNRKVLFPLALHSNESISSLVPASQKIEVRVYETFPKPVSLDPQDVYVFSSPSNVHSFFECNQLPVSSRVIAWGKTTQKALANHSVSVYATLEKSTIAELISVLEQSKR
jgi:uroporphyrinogen-III synthase